MLCLCPAPAAPTPSTAPKEKQSQTPSSVGFSDDPPQDTSPALPLPLPLSPSPFQGETAGATQRWVWDGQSPRTDKWQDPRSRLGGPALTGARTQEPGEEPSQGGRENWPTGPGGLELPSPLPWAPKEVGGMIGVD